MICCGNKISSPDFIDGTAYFVCNECGNVREIKNYRTYTPEESLVYFENKYGLNLPSKYIEVSGSRSTKVIKLNSTDIESLNFYFDDGFYEIGRFASIDPNHKNSIYDNISSGREWGLQNKFIPLEGDGHTWLALDYRESNVEPKVVVTETDDGNSLVVANSFDEFISNLLRYEEVYDLNGNIIYKK
ncbi:SMI1/KNR4 family protein [Shewanella polaris]|uniref:SMI1/KNR4 family protein n=1 Tax=Shewanella polaris TaxID=2588449 RepID=UPI00142F0EF0|nr:SMI1/KNR4 family protein [Shewanella polaris]